MSTHRAVLSFSIELKEWSTPTLVILLSSRQHYRMLFFQQAYVQGSLALSNAETERLEGWWMGKRVEREFVDQTRWNDVIGRENLALIESEPERFVVDAAGFNSWSNKLLDLLGDVSGKRILEFGSGRGEFSVELARRGASVTGLEIGPELVKLAGRVAEVNGVSDCFFRQGSITALPFADQEFDAVVGNAILHHLPTQGVVAAVSEAHRTLADGGTAFFVEPFENSRLFDFAQNLVPVGSPDDPLSYRPSWLQRSAWRHYLDNAEDRTLSDAEMRRAAAPFSAVKFDYHGCLARLNRVVPGEFAHRTFAAMDTYLTHERSPVRRFGQVGLVTCSK
jgi:2-polyprenyl-3-methyl-5-hydroxy-6-metoxy-1,4-benzoquinol methylase